jgi:hypothetical protein
MVTNLRRTFDFEGKTVLQLPNDPTIKLLRHKSPIVFYALPKKSTALR